MIKSLMTFAYRYNFTPQNYSFKFDIKSEGLLPRYFNSTEIENILVASLKRVHGYRYHAIASFMFGTGCRVSEVSNLKVSDFNMDENLIFIQKSKNNKERYIPMYPEVKKIINDYLGYTGLNSWQANNSGYLFSKDFGNERETNISIRAIQDICSKIFRSLDLDPNLTVHSFRHTFAVRCLQLGMPERDLALIMGHSNINTTFRYLQLFPVDLKKQVLEKYPFPLEKLVHQVLHWGEQS